MKIDLNETLMLYTNLGTAEESRRRVLNAFLDEEMPVERLAAIAPEWVTRAPAGQSRGSYAAGLTLRTALREGRRREAGAVLIISDESVPTAGFMDKLASMELPADWGMLLLSGKSESGRGLVAVRDFADWTAVLVRRKAMLRVSRLLKKDRAGRVAWMPGQRCVLPEGLKVYAACPALVERYETGASSHQAQEKTGGPEVHTAK